MKNLKLLLATTAILSTTLAISTYAGVEGDPTGTGYARIEASAAFTSPIRLQSTSKIFFGLLDPARGGEVTIEPDFEKVSITDTKNAIIANSSTGLTPRVGAIKLGGGALSEHVSGAHGSPSDNFDVQLDLVGETITLTETSTYDNSSASGATCGTVKNLTQGPSRVGGSGSDRYLEIPLGGTLEINSSYQPSTDSTACTGHTTVTYVVVPE